MYKIQFCCSNHVFEGSGMANNGLSLKHVEKNLEKNPSEEHYATIYKITKAS